MSRGMRLFPSTFQAIDEAIRGYLISGTYVLGTYYQEVSMGARIVPPI
jgi:hypothetical protein